MMKTNKNSAKWLEVLAVIGVLGLIALVVIPFLLFFRALRMASLVMPVVTAVVQPVVNNGSIGELGSQCGGAERLPCRPGLVCSAQAGDLVLGTCVKDPRLVSVELRQFGESCGSAFPPCVSGLFCRNSASLAPTCAKLNDQAPYIVSIKPEGLAPENGWYRGKAGAHAQVMVQTVNTKKVTLKILPKKSTSFDQAIDGGELRKLEGGKYVGDLTLTKDMAADVFVIVTAESGETAALSINVASNP